ncbi:MAG: fatty acid desaturase, partial [Paracoccaceae bacterium]
MRPARDEPIEWPTILLLVLTYLVWAAGTMLWGEHPLASLMLTAIAITQFSSLQHEVLHGHPFGNQKLNEALVFPALAL